MCPIFGSPTLFYNLIAPLKSFHDSSPPRAFRTEYYLDWIKSETGIPWRFFPIVHFPAKYLTNKDLLYDSRLFEFLVFDKSIIVIPGTCQRQHRQSYEMWTYAGLVLTSTSSLVSFVQSDQGICSFHIGSSFSQTYSTQILLRGQTQNALRTRKISQNIPPGVSCLDPTLIRADPPFWSL